MADSEQVDDEGRPETPARQAVEKSKQKQLAVAGVAVGLAGLIYIMVKGRSSAGSPASAPYTYPTVSPGGGSGLTSTSSGTSDPYSADILQTLTGISSQLAATNSAEATPPEQSRLVGAGYNTPGPGYSQIGGATGYMSAVQSGQQVFYQPAPGSFLPVSPQMQGGIITSGTPYTNTPTFLRTG